MRAINLDATRILRTPEAAQYLSLSESQLEKWRLNGEGPPFARLGRSVVYDRDDLDRWIADQKVKASGDRRMRAMSGDRHPGFTRSEWEAWFAARPRDPSFVALGYLDNASFFISVRGRRLVFNDWTALYRRRAILSLTDDNLSEVLRLFPMARFGETFAPSLVGSKIMCMAAEAGRLDHPEHQGFLCVRRPLMAIDGKGGREARWAVAAGEPSHGIKDDE